MRFHHLLKQEVEEKGVSYRQIGMKSGVPPMSISDYILLGTEPRLKAIEKIAAYFHEPVAAMLLEHDDHNSYDVEIYHHLAHMTIDEKKQLLNAIKTIRGINAP